MEYVRNGGNFENEEYDRKDFEKGSFLQLIMSLK